MGLFIDLHAIHSVPPSNLNRDDTGAPKSAFYGGVRRARVSSQAWKKAIRSQYADLLDTSDLGVRTKRAVELLRERMLAMQPRFDAAEAEQRAAAVLGALGIKVEEGKSRTRQKSIDAGEDAGAAAPTTQYLIFWSNRQLDRLAALALQTEKPTKKAAAEAADHEHGIDVALFGRMVADAADINVDASIQVAHAISTHAVEIEQDYFTAVDEQNPEEETGAGMIGTVEFNAATLYRYATVNVLGLHHNLGDFEATVRAVEAVVHGFVTSMPTGKQNTFANRTVPDGVLIAVRTDQPVNLVGAFEEPVESNGGYARASVERLVAHAQRTTGFLGDAEATFVAAASPAADPLTALASGQNLSELVRSVGSATRERLAGLAS